MTREEIEKLPAIIDVLLSESVIVDTKEKLHEKLTEVCNLAIKALEQEPRKGHWIIDTHKIRAFGKKYETHDYSVHCDKCNYACDYTTDKHGSLASNFCPNCGAKMESEDEK